MLLLTLHSQSHRRLSRRNIPVHVRAWTESRLLPDRLNTGVKRNRRAFQHRRENGRSRPTPWATANPQVAVVHQRRGDWVKSTPTETSKPRLAKTVSAPTPVIRAQENEDRATAQWGVVFVFECPLRRWNRPLLRPSRNLSAIYWQDPNFLQRQLLFLGFEG